MQMQWELKWEGFESPSMRLMYYERWTGWSRVGQTESWAYLRGWKKRRLEEEEGR